VSVWSFVCIGTVFDGFNQKFECHKDWIREPPQMPLMEATEMVNKTHIDPSYKLSFLSHRDLSVANEHFCDERNDVSAVIESRANEAANPTVHVSPDDATCLALRFKRGTEVFVGADRHRERTLPPG
jgi:hypothetical protein